MRACRRIFLAGLLALALHAAAPSSASAATASISGTDLVVSAGPAETNNLMITTEVTDYRITETGAGVTLSPGAGCISGGANQVLCPIAGLASISVAAGDLDDIVTVSAMLPATLNGGDGDDRLSGGTGNDTLNGDQQEDILDGGVGADALNGGTGSDWASYSLRIAAVAADLEGDADDGEAGENDTIASDIENLIGGNGNDTLTGNGGSNAIDGGLGGDVMSGGGGSSGDWVMYTTRIAAVTADLEGDADDGEAGENDTIASDIEHLIGGTGNDTFTGNGQANVFDGGTGADVVRGGGGADWMLYWFRSAPLTVTLDGAADDGEAGENDNVDTDVEHVIGGDGNDTLTGNGEANLLFGADGNDTLTGDGGDDTLYGGDNTDVMNGGAGVDVASYSTHSAPVTADLDGVADDGAAGENDNVGSDVENLTGGSGADTLTGDGGDNLFDGRAGADTLNGGAGTDTVTYASRSTGVTASLDGAADDGEAGENDNVGTDVENLIGGSAGDTLSGHGGDNGFDGGLGADTLNGGAGTDTVTYASRSAAVAADLDGAADDGEAGENDAIGSDVENLIGGSAGDMLRGGSGGNVLQGGGGDDTLDGGTGPDNLNGGGGTDTVTYASRSTGVMASLDGAADDGEAGENDNVGSDVENLIGGSAGDTLLGSADPNTLDGGGGDDTLDGGTASDQLEGAAGADSMRARDGARDTVACGSESDSVVADPDDAAAADCESVDTGQLLLPPPLGATFKFKPGESRSVPVGTKGVVRLPVTCGLSQGVCEGTITLYRLKRKKRAKDRNRRARTSRRSRPKRAQIGRASFSIAAGRTVRVKVRLSRNGRRRVLSERRLRCRASVKTVAADGTKTLAEKTLTLLAPTTKKEKK